MAVDNEYRCVRLMFTKGSGGQQSLGTEFVCRVCVIKVSGVDAWPWGDWCDILQSEIFKKLNILAVNTMASEIKDQTTIMRKCPRCGVWMTVCLSYINNEEEEEYLLWAPSQDES